jgi:uncharacterized Zn finger protein
MSSASGRKSPDDASRSARRAGQLEALRASLAAPARANGDRKASREAKRSWQDAAGYDEDAAGYDEDAAGYDEDAAGVKERTPRDAGGGVPARTRKGPSATSWWSRRFLGSLESVTARDRMVRGRAYVRRGRVMDLRIGPGRVEAVVQGSREEPYLVQLRLPVVPEEDWERLVALLSLRADYAARMLAGELPPEVEDVFASEGASLLPAPHARLVTECTCTDWENPCAHVAAACYLLADELEREPFSLLEWRGRRRDDILAQLRRHRHERIGAAVSVEGSDRGGGDGAGRDMRTRAPRATLSSFWTAGPAAAFIRIRPHEATAPAAALRLTVRGVIRVRGRDLGEVLAPAYRRIVAAAAARARR